MIGRWGLFVGAVVSVFGAAVPALAAVPAYTPAPGSPVVLPAGVVAQAMFEEDVDQDGDVDVIVAMMDGALELLRNGGAGVLTRDAAAAVGPDGGVDHGHQVGDVNRDGRIDFIHGRKTPPGPPRVLVSAPGGGWTVVPLGGAAVASAGAALADLDGDGDDDALAALPGNSLRLWDSNGDGTFGPQRDPGVSTPTFVELETRDLDADGDEDVYTGRSFITVLRDVGATYQAEPAVARAMVPVGPLLDADRDGLQDAFDDFPDFSGAPVRAKWGLPGGAFSAPEDLDGSSGVTLRGIDLEGDGSPELLRRSVDADSRLDVIRFAGRAIAGTDRLTAPGTAPLDAVTPDVNRDGAPDLVVVVVFAAGNRVEVLHAPPPPPAPPVPPAPPPTPSECTDGIDQDRDGLTDGVDPQCKAGRGVEGPADDPLLACTGRDLTLLDVLARSGGRVFLRGVADPALAGRTVTLHAGRKRVASVKVTSSGGFETTVKLRTTRSTRFQARLGTRRTPNLKLDRRTVDAKAQRRGAQIELSGRVTTGRRGARVELLQRAGCGPFKRIAVGKLLTRGRFRIKAPLPAALDIAVFRVRIQIPGGRTFSLPRTVRLTG